MDQLNKARERLKTYEKLRNNLRGLDDLAAGLEILIDNLKSDNLPDQKTTAKNIAITYQRDSLFWLKGVLENRSDDDEELEKLNYSITLLDEFVEVNELIGTDSEFDHVKQRIEKRRNELHIDLRLTVRAVAYGILKLSGEEQEACILLLEKLGLSKIKYEVEKARARCSGV